MAGKASASAPAAGINKTAPETKINAKARLKASARKEVALAITTNAALATAAIPVRKPPVVVDAKLRDRFIAALRDCGAVAVAAEQVGSDRWAMYRAREHNPDFAAAWDLALGRVPILAVDPAKLEAALFKRLLRGVKRRRTYQGDVVDVYRDYDDRVAFQFLARLMPDKYGADVAGFAPEPVKVMSREEFMAAIRARPRTSELPPIDQFGQ